MTWYYAAGGKQVGPVEEAAFDGLVTAGVIRGDTLVWHEGMAAWQPLAAARGSTVPAPAAVRYGGFWIRFLARVIDAVILGFAGLIVRLPLTMMLGIGMGRGPLMAPGLRGSLFLLSLAMAIIYEVAFVSARGATPGKMALGLKIIRANGAGVSPGLALGRYCAHWISAITLGIGYIMAAFDSQKRALHDRICETRVIYVR